jgi:hypothetical protein
MPGGIPISFFGAAAFTNHLAGFLITDYVTTFQADAADSFHSILTRVHFDGCSLSYSPKISSKPYAQAI